MLHDRWLLALAFGLDVVAFRFNPQYNVLLRRSGRRCCCIREEVLHLAALVPIVINLSCASNTADRAFTVILAIRPRKTRVHFRLQKLDHSHIVCRSLLFELSLQRLLLIKIKLIRLPRGC